jgi:hypothetical protein
VFLFTAALFLSGYVLQQQTVRDLRAAIKPQLVRHSGPDLFLPPQFGKDGYLVDAVVIETTHKDIESGEDDDMIGATRRQKAERKKMKEIEAAKAQKRSEHEISQDANSNNRETKKEEKVFSRAERRKRIKEQILADGDGESFKGYRRRMW